LLAGSKYSSQEVYGQMCSKCHGVYAEGNPKKKGPALDDMTVSELEMEIDDILKEGYQSSGTEHEVMEHNAKVISKKGMDYNARDMATYIYFSFNPNAKKVSEPSDDKVYSTSEIYKNMCSKCHGMQAEGNTKKKGPALNDKSKGELEMDLYDLASGGYQSSGSSNEVMEHNQKKIFEKGMKYHPEDMASYIYYNFNTEHKK
jgi:cytochrome c553